MAYAVLVSLAQTIDEILNHHHCISISLLQSQQMISIHEYVIFLQVLLEDFPEKVNSDLEGKIRDVSTEAADVIEYFMLKQFETRNIRQEHQDLDELERLSNEFDSIAGEAMHILRNEDIRTTVDSPATGSAISSARFAPSHKKDAMVGFDDDLLAIKERLCGEPSKLQVIPIVGMGGIETTNQILKDHHHSSISINQKHQIKSIHEYTIFLQAFLEDFPEKVDTNLEGKIRDAAEEAEDIIEYFMWGQLASNRHRRTYDLHELKRVAEEIDSIIVEAMYIKNSFTIKGTATVDSAAAAAAAASSRLAPTHKKDAIVGFDDHLLAIKELLCGESSKLQVIPIVGMGGIGKTTLAAYAYDDRLMVDHFQIRAWVTVSQDYSAQEIVSNLLDFMKEFETERCEQSNELKVYKALKGRKYLIVMDDMWSTKAWDDVRSVFPDDNNGSRIILTTRLSDVAAYADSSSPLHKMHLMDARQSWNLFKRKVFAHKHYPPELRETGKVIARSCGGLPLAIVVIAGLLSTVSETRASWEEIAENVKSVVATKDGQFEKILSLSYTHLPHHLRPCFLYIGAFPEDRNIYVSKLIRVWIAEGFIKSSACKSFEEVAEEYLEDLVKRNLVLVSGRKCNGKIKICRLHDLMRELCIRISQQEKFLLHVIGREVPKISVRNQRRLSINEYNLNWLANIDGSTTRTILIETERLQVQLRCFRLLRLLDVVHAFVDKYEMFPAQAFELFHLRYLAFGSPVRIPAAISDLQNLQTLIIHPRKTGSSFRFVSLPSAIWSMPQLRNLICFYFRGFPNPDEERGKKCALENLQTLSAVEDLICTETILQKIPNVKKLHLIYSFYKFELDDYRLENLVHLQQLEKLKVSVPKGFPSPSKKVNPTFSTSLKKLHLSGWEFSWKSTMMGVVGSLPNLQVLKLQNPHHEWDQWETSEGEFPQLKFLLIENSYLEHWITEGTHFPRLESLLLQNCVYLSEIPDGIGEIPTLEYVEVMNGKESLFESAKRMQDDQQSWGNEAFEVRCLRRQSEIPHLLY